MNTDAFVSAAADKWAPPDAPSGRLVTLWPDIRRDAEALRDVANPITPTTRVRDLWRFNTLSVPRLHLGTAVRELLARLPAEVEHLLVIPWLGISGGSEKVTERLIRFLAQHYEFGRVAILAPDTQFDLSPAQRLYHDVPIVALNDVDRQMAVHDRMALTDIIFRQLRPRTIHVINSDIGWQLLRACGSRYALDSSIYVNIYSDIRLKDGAPAGYFWRYLPDVLPCLTGVIADNAAVVARATCNFSLVPEQVARFHVVPTPIVSLRGEGGLPTCRAFVPVERQHTLWMSRIAHEKRLDVVQAIAERRSARSFSIYGAIIPGSVPVGFLDWTKATPNVHHEGGFTSLAALPLHQFDSYLFTTSAEGMPLALLEASMLGLPVVTPAVGGIGEFIDDATGWLVPAPDDIEAFVAALDDIAARPREAARRVEAAQRRLLERHAWNSFARSLSTIPRYLGIRKKL